MNNQTQDSAVPGPGAANAASDVGANGDDTWLTMAEAIARLSTTRATFNRWLKSGRVRGVKVGRQWRFRASELQRLLEGETPTMSLPVSGAELLNALNADSPRERRQRPSW